jgi:hypothetical protein
MTEITTLETLASRWLQAWTGNNPTKLLAYYADDALYADPSKRNGLNGKEQIQPYLEKLLAANPNWVWQAVEVMPTAQGFTFKWKATIPVGDTILEETGLDIVELNADGLITRNEVWFDRSRWMQLLAS